MNELNIKNHDFEDAKNSIKKFSEQSGMDLYIKRVDSNKDIGEWFSSFFVGEGFGSEHKVSGKELNELISQLQSNFQSVNETQIKLIKEFGQVYNALEALDKDYIKAIIASINSTKIASAGIESAQKDINKIIEEQKNTLELLIKFKKNLDRYTHLKDIDKMWDSLTDINNAINDISGELNLKEMKLTKQEDEIDRISKYISEISNKESLDNSVITELSRKLNFSYALAGSSLGLALIGIAITLSR